MKLKNTILGILIVLALLVTVSSSMALTIDAIPAQTANANEEFTYQVTTDYPTSNVTFDVLTSLGSISSTGLYNWTPTTADEGAKSVTIYAENKTNSSDNDTVTFTITVSVDDASFSAQDPVLGSTTQDRGETTSLSWTVTNPGDEPITNVAVSTANVESKYVLNVSQDKTTIAAGESMIVTIDAYVPWDKNSASEDIGDITISGTGATTITKKIYMEAESMIDVTAKFEGRTGNDEKADSDETITLDPFDDITLIIEVENTYSDRDDFTEDIDMDVDIFVDSNDIDDLNNEDDYFNSLNAGDKDDVTFSFTLDPNDIDFKDEPFDVDIKVEAIDSEGALHTKEFTVEIELDRSTRDVRFSNVAVSKTVLSCDEKSISVDATIFNVGTRDLDDAMFRVTVDGQDGRALLKDLKIDENEEEDYRLTFDFNNKLKEGTTILNVFAHPENDLEEWTESKVFELTVLPCSGTGTTTNTNTGTTTPNTGSTTVITTTPKDDVTVSGQPVSTATGTSMFSGTGTGYLIGIGIVVIILIVLVVVLLVVVLKK